MNFIIQDINHIKKIRLIDKITIIIYSFIPIFLIIGTGASELAVIILVSKFIIDFLFFKKINLYNKSLIFFLLLIYFSLLVNLIFSVNIENSFLRNIFFIKYIIFIIGTIDFFSKRKLEFFLVIKVWLLILVIFSFDLIIQFITHKNMIGLESPLKYHRLSGFMGDELKAGSLILSFCFIVSGYLVNTSNNKIKGLILLCLFVATIFITGDRSNFLKSLLIVFCLTFFIDKKFIKKFSALFLIMFSLIFLIISTNDVFKERFKDRVIDGLSQNNFNIVKFVKKTEYGKIYNSAYQLFLEKKLFGVGNKNFRILCEEDFRAKYSFTKNLKETKCNTHPHQIYFEILVEHGIFGLSLLLIALFSFIYQNYKIIFRKKDFLLASLFFSNLIVFIPLLPGGSFFTSFNAVIFWLNISFFYSYKNICNREKSLK
tara:strand:+ start:447 stop:1733 length:1287 start_codon:yes stop_codon:yes gene_type:complete